MKEKSEKIKNFYSKYNSWWLVFVDKILIGGFDDDEIKDIKSKISVNSCWNKVIVLNSNGTNILEFY